jgi:hypothetical protein
MQVAFEEIIYHYKRYVGISVCPKLTQQFHSQECRITWNLVAENFCYLFGFSALNFHLKTYLVIL